jgi:hypothetical protein
MVIVSASVGVQSQENIQKLLDVLKVSNSVVFFVDFFQSRRRSVVCDRWLVVLNTRILKSRRRCLHRDTTSKVICSFGCQHIDRLSMRLGLHLPC